MLMQLHQLIKNWYKVSWSVGLMVSNMKGCGDHFQHSPKVPNGDARTTEGYQQQLGHSSYSYNVIHGRLRFTELKLKVKINISYRRC